MYPEAVHIIAGDFNQADLKAVLPKFYQHVKCATRGENTLDKVYFNIKLGFRAKPLPHLGQSDHMSLFLIPAYTPLSKSAPVTSRTVNTWPEGASQQLQDCFQSTNWDIFEHQNLEQYTTALDKCIRVYPNKKPWMTKEVQSLLRERNTAFRSGDGVLYSTARANLKRGNREAKVAYKRRIEDCFQSNNSRQVWQGVQHITSYRPSNLVADDGGASLAEELDGFFARFEVQSPESATLCSPAPDSCTLTVEEHQVRCTLRTVNPRKAAGPDRVTGLVLRDCASQLAGVFTNIFNQSLSQATVPLCLKSSTIVPLPKKTIISSLNDYRPVGLTPVIMKASQLDPFQFAYRRSRGTDDAVLALLNTVTRNLMQPKGYARVLFVNFNSAFNPMKTHILLNRLTNLGDSGLTLKISFPFAHRVCINGTMSDLLTVSTGCLQGRVLSLVLSSLFTNDSMTEQCFNPAPP
ncbi:hypothetical protein LDENG_00164230 [Lucifuga dentata]|nr:hypothetical protein LDENG_00164230 [Lucifuga dentata]